MFKTLDELRLKLKHEKTFVGKSDEEFDLLGYHITPQDFSLSQKLQEKALEIAKRRYAQRGNQLLQEYLKRWRTWAHADLPSLIHSIENVIQDIGFIRHQM